MKRQKLTALLLIAIFAVTALVMTGCGPEAPTTLEEYIAQDEEMKAEIEQAAANNELEITVKENNLEYKFSYKEELKDEEVELMNKTLTEAIEAQKDTFTNLVTSLEEETGLTGISVTLIYTDGAGKELYSITFPEA